MPTKFIRLNAPYNQPDIPLKFHLDRFTLAPVRVRQKSYGKSDTKADTAKTNFLVYTPDPSLSF